MMDQLCSTQKHFEKTDRKQNATKFSIVMVLQDKQHDLRILALTWPNPFSPMIF